MEGTSSFIQLPLHVVNKYLTWSFMSSEQNRLGPRPCGVYILIRLCPPTPMKLYWEAREIYMLLSHSQIWETPRIWDWLSHLSHQLCKIIQFSQKQSKNTHWVIQRSSLDSWPCTHIQMYIAFCTYWMGLSSTVLLDPHKIILQAWTDNFLFSLLKNQGHRVRQSIVSLINDQCWTWKLGLHLGPSATSTSLFSTKELESALF